MRSCNAWGIGSRPEGPRGASGRRSIVPRRPLAWGRPGVEARNRGTRRKPHSQCHRPGVNHLLPDASSSSVSWPLPARADRECIRCVRGEPLRGLPNESDPIFPRASRAALPLRVPRERGCLARFEQMAGMQHDPPTRFDARTRAQVMGAIALKCRRADAAASGTVIKGARQTRVTCARARRRPPIAPDDCGQRRPLFHYKGKAGRSPLFHAA